MAIFDNAPLKAIESTLSFPGFATACKKSVYSICPFLRYSQFYYSPATKLATPILDHAHPKNLSAFKFCESVSTSQAISMLRSGDKVD